MVRKMIAMLRTLRCAAAGLLAALAASAACAHDYVVVASTEPAVARGAAVDAGQNLAVAPGHAVTLMHASGDLLTLRGAAGGVMAPRRQAAGADAARLELLRTMVATRADETREGLGARRRTRGGVCPSPDTLATLDAIAQAVEAGCAEPASRAFDAWLASERPAEP